MNWNEYQQAVADFFRSIGAWAETDAIVKGVRGSHKIDVLVKLKHFGIDVIWIIECKFWKTSIPKEKILTLQQIVQDVGADRGLLMSESGFQAGAVKSASSSNITLSSLGELQDISSEELSKLKLRFISSKLQQLTERYHAFIPWESFSHIKPIHLIEYFLPSLFTIRTELFKAQNSNFPIQLFSVTAENIQEFITACEDIFDKAEVEIEKVEKDFNKNVEIGLKSFESLKKLIAKLLDALKDIITNMDDPSKQNQIRIQAVDVMKQVGDLTLEIRTYTNNRSYPSFKLIHQILIDQLYIDLVNEKLQKQDVDKTYNSLSKAYSQFENVFQPINIVS
ncbi:MAG: restriction endonuclease [Moheibacter sp.]